MAVKTSYSMKHLRQYNGQYTRLSRGRPGFDSQSENFLLHFWGKTTELKVEVFYTYIVQLHPILYITLFYYSLLFMLSRKLRLFELIGVLIYQMLFYGWMDVFLFLMLFIVCLSVHVQFTYITGEEMLYNQTSRRRRKYTSFVHNCWLAWYGIH